MKVKTKSIIALMIALFAVLIIGATQVNAVEVTDNNSTGYSESEQQKVDNIVKGINKNVIVTVELNGNHNGVYEKAIEQALEPLTKAGYTTTYVGSAGGGGGIFIETGESRYNIYKNGTQYGYIDMKGTVQDKLTIPSTVEDTETAIINYATPIIEEYIEKLDKDPYYFGSVEYKNGDGIILTKANNNYYNVSSKKTKELIASIILEKETSNTINKEDTTTGIKLETTTAVVPNNVILSSVTVKEDTLKNIFTYTVNKATAYDINLLKDGTKIQPNGKVKVSIPIPEGYDKTRLEIYRVEENKQPIKYDVKVEGNYATFETDHFSIYVLAEKKEEKAPTKPAENKPTNKGEKDETPKTGIQDITYIITAVVIISAVGIIATIKRKQSKH